MWSESKQSRMPAMTSDWETETWFAALKAGDAQAAQHLWTKYYARLVQLAARRLQGTSRRVADEEDVALSAFHSFLQGLQAGRFPDIHDRQGLWRLLVVITARKAADLANRNACLKRGAAAVRGELDWEQIVGSQPTPEFSCQVREELNRLLAQLGDATLVAIALAKLEGHTNDEIASQMQVVPRTIERKLAIIRQCWAEEGPP